MPSLARVSLAALAVLGVGAALAFRSRGADPVVEITGLEPYDLRTAGLVLDAPAEVRVRAVGAEKPRPGGVLAFLGVEAPRWLRDDERLEAWVGNAWILDASTRKVVWELRTEERADEDDGLFEFDGAVALPKGTYEVHYGSVAVPFRREDGQWSRRDRRLADDFAMVVSGAGRALDKEGLAAARRAAGARAIVSLTGIRDGETRQAAFALSRAMELDLYAVGEARRDEAFDRGWIIDADTRKVVWELDWDGSAPAGGASKNREARTTLRLPAGRYAAFFAADDSHGPTGWNSPPPHDPEFWGLTLSVREPALRAAVHSFAYEHVPSAAAFVRQVGVRNDETRRDGFTLARPMAVRVYALGEGSRHLSDHAWITDADGREVWRMTAERTTHAGGARKNRVADTVLALAAGSYVVRYTSDGSHSAEGWNAGAPTDGGNWGVTVLPADGRPAAAGLVSRYAPAAAPGTLAAIEMVRDHREEAASFTLASAADVQVRVLGEGSNGEMHDYAWIEEARSGRTVWTTTLARTTHAGGAEKNRLAVERVRLPAGAYRLRYRTDDSHAFGDWNAPPPAAPEAWGAVVTRAR